jgi:serine/threonine protein kinase
LKDLQHDNIIRFHRIIKSIDHVIIEMEKLNGDTLEAFIDKQSMTIRNRPKVLSSGNIIGGANYLLTSDLTVEQKCAGTPSIVPGLRNTIVDESIAAKIIKDICMGLTHIHKKNYIHRDLKPENILLNITNSEKGEP